MNRLLDVDLECLCANCGSRYGAHWGTHCFSEETSTNFVPAAKPAPSGYALGLEDARKAVLHEVLHFDEVNCGEDVAYNAAIYDASQAIVKLQKVDA